MKAPNQLTTTGSNPNWWHQPTVNMTPFEMLKIIADCDAPGEPLPAAVFHWLRAGVRLYFAGETDLTKNLGLRPCRGGAHDTPLNRERIHRRNTLIRAICEAQPGPSLKARAEQTAALLQATPGQRTTAADVRQFYLDHPWSSSPGPRQIMRIVSGKP
jgi:hypothetical protein